MDNIVMEIANVGLTLLIVVLIAWLLSWLSSKDLL